jgi:hypothetical protein
MARASAATVLVGVCLFATSCGIGLGGDGGGTPRERFATVLTRTRDAGSAAVSEHVTSDPVGYEMRVTGRTRFEYNDALLTVTHIRHPQLAPGTVFHVQIANVPYVRRTDGNWYVPPYHTGEFELGYSDFMFLLSKAYGRVEQDGSRALLVWMSSAKLAHLRTSQEGSLGPLGTLYDLVGPMRVALDDQSRMTRIEYTVTGRYYFSLTPMHRVRVTLDFTDFDRDFDVEPPPEDAVTPGPLIPPQPGARAESSRL